MAIDYKKAGVDIAAGDALVDWLQSSKSKKDKRIIGGIGGFAALFRADFKKMKKPCLVSSTDGVGTKVLLAAEFNRHEDVGQDLVAMCVNDLICVGADPLFFLDYYACGQLNLKNAQTFLSGLRRACAEAQCSLIGGETAEMPGVYAREHFDCAGFAVGVVDEVKALGAHRVREKDVLLAVPSSGFHSNGYSLLRKVFADDLKVWADELLKPTYLYVKLVQDLRKKIAGLKACANITGGGIENIPRVLPAGLVARLEPWHVPEPFLEVQRRSQMSWAKMLETLNCGLGFVVVVHPDEADRALKLIQKKFSKAWRLGVVEKAKTKKAPSSVHMDYKKMEGLNHGSTS